MNMQKFTLKKIANEVNSKSVLVKHKKFSKFRHVGLIKVKSSE